MRKTILTIDDRTPAAECRTMDEVRGGVDALDRALVALLAERQTYMDAAARIKPSRDLVRDEARIEAVVERVRRAALAAGLTLEIAEPVWRTLIEQSIRYEMQVFDRIRT